MKILALINSASSACDYHRISLPLRTMRKEEGDAIEFAYAGTTTLKRASILKPDIVTFNRAPGWDILTLAEMQQEGNYKLVMDIDDYWQLYPNHINAKEWERSKTEKRIIEAMEISDAVITTNSRLAEEVIKYNSKVVVLPNALPFGRNQFTEVERSIPVEKTRFVYAGGSSHLYDLKSIENVFKRAHSDYHIDKHGEIILAGYVANDSGTYWKAAHNIVKHSGISSIRPRAQLDRYMELYNDAEVVIAPLENNKFNTYKSNLKLIEAGCKKLPIIASKMWPYIEDEEMDGLGIFLCETTAQWVDALRFCVKNPEKVKEMGLILHDYVTKKYNLDIINEKRRVFYKSLIE